VHNPLTRWTYPAVDQGTVFVTGPNHPASSAVSTNDGTIEAAAGGFFAAAGALTLDIGGFGTGDIEPGSGLLENNGVIDAYVGSTILLEGAHDYLPVDSTPSDI
jgi:hypothetical protein